MKFYLIHNLLKLISCQADVVYQNLGSTTNQIFDLGLLKEVNKDTSSLIRPVPTKIKYKTKHLSINEMYSISIYAYVVGCSPEKLFNWSCKECTPETKPKEIKLVKEGKNHVYLLIDSKNRLFVSFNPANIGLLVRDLISVKVPYKGDALPGSLVHYGIYKSYLEIKDSVLKVLKYFFEKYNFKELYSIGYSLGGGLSTLFIIDLNNYLKKNNYKADIKLATFGAPRVGNLQFVESLINLNISLTRYTYKNDFIVNFPPSYTNYFHPPVEIHTRENQKTGQDETIICSEDYVEDPDCSWKYKILNDVFSHFKYFDKSAFTC